MNLRCLCITAFLLIAAARLSPAETQRFAAMLAGGQRVEGKQLKEWQHRSKNPKLDDQDLMSDGNPLAWLRDRTLHPSSPPKSYVEMFSGDRLPGEVVGFAAADDPRGWQSLPPHFIVRPSVNVSPPHGQTHEGVRVVRRFVRRIVWQQRPGGHQYQPSTLVYRDGRTLTYRAVRFSGDRVQVLQADGQTSVAFREIAQLHLPAEEAWESYYDELAVLSPEGEDRLLQIESTSGLVATGSRMTFQAQSQGNAGDSNNWFHAVQPAWSLDAIWTQGAKISMRRCWPPEQVPLSHIAPMSSKSHGFLATGERRWRRNQNVQRRALQAGEQSYGWGYGVHAYSELHFPLPQLATGFRTRVGLDDVVADGGCAIARVYVNAAEGKPLYESPRFVGSRAVHDTQNLTLPNNDGKSRTLILQVDPAHEGRPSGADPLDIRDVVDWLDPVVTLDRAKLLTEISRRLPSRVPAFDGWTVEQHPEGDYKWRSDLEHVDENRPGNFLPTVMVHKQPLTLRRTLKVGQEDQWLVVSAYRQRGESPKPELIVRIDGIDVAAAPIPLQSGSQAPTPLAVSLSPYRGHEVDLEVAQLPAVESGFPPVVWYALKISSQLPMLYRALEDDAELAAAGGLDDAAARLIDADKHAGLRSAEITRGGKFRLRFDQPVSIRSNPQFGEQRFLRFAFRKLGQGEVRIELETANNARTPAIYAAGVPSPTDDLFREKLWFDDDLPLGAKVDGDEGDASFHWSGRKSGPVFHGEQAIHRRASGLGQQFFLSGENSLSLSPGDQLFTYVHLDPKSPPRAVMLQFITADGQWRRAYWGENVIPLGQDGTPSRMRIGDLPTPGRWTRLDVPIERLGLSSDTPITGWALTQHNGAVWWDAGGVRSPRGGPVYAAKSVWQLELPPEWIVMTRDVYADFGDLDVTGIVLHVPDGERALLDHIYFGRTAEDFKLLPQAPSPEDTNQQARRELAGAVLDKGRPATVAIHIDGRQATGVLVGGEGYVLTAGHVLGGPNKACEVQLPTGQRLPATSRGICRSGDLGLVQITDRKDQPLPGLDLHDAKDFPTNQLYVGFGLEPFDVEFPAASAHIVGIVRDFRETLWTDFKKDLLTTGGPLLARDGRIIGTQIRDSRFGGFLYTKSFVAREHWDRMKAGEIWGDWFPGSGPMLGVVITSTTEGAKITEVYADSPARAADIKSGDLITRLDTQPVASLEDVYRIMAGKDPGQEVDVELMRGEEKLSKKMKLMPRVP